MQMNHVLILSLLFSNLSFAQTATKKDKKDVVDNDYLTVLTMLKAYEPTSDIEMVAKVTPVFYDLDKEIEKIYKENGEKLVNEYLALDKTKQTDATKVLIKSLQIALDACTGKLKIQQDASKSFGDAIEDTVKLVKKEKDQEKSCIAGLNKSIALASDIKSKCASLNDKDEQSSCEQELAACSNKLNKDLSVFESKYLSVRAKIGPSKVLFTEVSEQADYLTANIPGSAKVCSNYSTSMSSTEQQAGCLEKIKNDEKNESYGTVETEKVVHEDIDSKMLTPTLRADVWKKLKSMVDEKIKKNELLISKLQAHIKKLSDFDAGMANVLAGGNEIGYEGLTADDFLLVGTNSGHVISKTMIDAYFATKPSMDDILTKSAELGLTSAQLAQILNIAGYGNVPPTDRNNYKQTNEREKQLASMIESEVSKKGGSFKPGNLNGEIQLPNVSPLDMTKVVISKKGIITSDQVKEFLTKGPTDQEVFAKMYELGLRKSDLSTLMNSADLLYVNGDPRNVQKNDKDYGSIYNRLDQELYRGTTGYGVADPYDPNSLIVKGTGHISDEENKTWIPYGFKNVPNQKQDTSKQADTPTIFSTGGNFKAVKITPNSNVKKK